MEGSSFQDKTAAKSWMMIKLKMEVAGLTMLNSVYSLIPWVRWSQRKSQGRCWTNDWLQMNLIHLSAINCYVILSKSLIFHLLIQWPFVEHQLWAKYFVSSWAPPCTATSGWVKGESKTKTSDGAWKLSSQGNRNVISQRLEGKVVALC